MRTEISAKPGTTRIKTMEIKKLSTEYIRAAAEIERACFSSPWDEAALQAEFDNPCAHLSVALDGDKAAGYAAVYCVCGEADIARIAVLPEYRRQGIATRLLLKSFEEIAADCVFLDVRQSNTAAICLYKSLGFVQIGTRKNYYSNPTENAILMKREN